MQQTIITKPFQVPSIINTHILCVGAELSAFFFFFSLVACINGIIVGIEVAALQQTNVSLTLDKAIRMSAAFKAAILRVLKFSVFFSIRTHFCSTLTCFYFHHTTDPFPCQITPSEHFILIRYIVAFVHISYIHFYRTPLAFTFTLHHNKLYPLPLGTPFLTVCLYKYMLWLHPSTIAVFTFCFWTSPVSLCMLHII